MRILLNKNNDIEETIIEVTYRTYDRKLQEIVNLVEDNSHDIKGIHKGETHFIKTDSIYYIESIDNLTFLYTEDIVFESKEKLYVIEEALGKMNFIRISKSTILNMNYLKSVTSISNYRLEATLLNNEKLIINRHYMKNIKVYLNL